MQKCKIDKIAKEQEQQQKKEVEYEYRGLRKNWKVWTTSNYKREQKLKDWKSKNCENLKKIFKRLERGSKQGLKRLENPIYRKAYKCRVRIVFTVNFNIIDAWVLLRVLTSWEANGELSFWFTFSEI